MQEATLLIISPMKQMDPRQRKQLKNETNLTLHSSKIVVVQKSRTKSQAEALIMEIMPMRPTRTSM